MELRDRIREWANWPGWRRHAPAAGSVVAHGIAGLLIASMIAAAAKPLRPAPQKPRGAVLEVSLLPEPREDTPPSVRPPQPRPLPPPSAKSESVPVAAPERKGQPSAATSFAANAPSASDGGVYLGPSPLAGPAGLQGLAHGDPCNPKVGRKPKDCLTNWAGKIGTAPSLLPRSKEDLAKYYAEFMPTCENWTGCENKEWISTNGTRSVAGTRMAGGAASAGGINDLTGRLPQKPDFIDRGFGD